MSSAYQPLIAPESVKPLSPETERKHHYPPYHVHSETSPSTSSSSTSSTYSTGEKAGIAVGVILAIVLIVWIVMKIRKRKSNAMMNMSYDTLPSA